MCHLIFGRNHPLMRGENVCSMFFLQPTGFDTKSTPALMTGDDNGAGSIEYQALYDMMRATERCGISIFTPIIIVTRFPHQSRLYQIFTSKEWTHQLCQDPAYCIPASIAVDRMWIESDLQSTSKKALKMLQMVKERQVKLL